MADMESMVVKLALDNSNFTRGIQNMNREIRKATSEFRNSASGTKNFEKGLDGLQAKSKMLTKQIESQTKIVDAHKEKVKESKDRLDENAKAQVELKEKITLATAEYKKSVEATGENSEKSKELKAELEGLGKEYTANEEKIRNNVRTLENYETKTLDAETKLNNMKSTLADTTKELEKQSSKWTQLGDDMKALGEKTSSIGKNIKGVGDQLSLFITGPLTALGVAGAKATTQLNEGLANISTLIPGQGQRLEELKKDIQATAIEVGKSTNEIADGVYNIISAYGDADDTAEKALLNAKGARAGLAETSDALALTSSVMKGFGDTTAEANEKALDLAFATVKLGQTSFKDLGESIGKVVPTTVELGISQEEMFNVFATGTGVTGNASEVATQYQGVLKSLMAPTDSMAGLMKKLGVENGQAMIDQYGLIESMKLITESAKESGEPLQKYIGSIQGQVLALALTGEQYDTYNEKLLQMQASTGAMTEAFNEQTDGVNKTGFTYEQAMAKMEVATQNLGDALAPVIGSIAELFDKVATKLSELSPKTLDIITKVGILIAAIGPILSVGGRVVEFAGGLIAKVGELSTIIGELGGVTGLLTKAFTVLTGPVGITIAIIGSLIAVIVKLYNTNEEFRGKVIEIWNSVKDIISNVIELIKSIINVFVEWFKAIWEKYGDTVISITTTIFNTLADIIKAAVDVINGIIQTFIGLFTGDWKKFGEGLKTIWQGVWNALKSIVDGAWSLLKGALNSLKNSITGFFKDLIQDFVGFGKDLITGLGDGIVAMKDAVVGKIKGVGESIANGFKSVLGMHSPSRVFKGFGKNIVEGLGDGISENKNIAVDEIEALGEDLNKQMASSIDDIHSKLVNALKSRYQEESRETEASINKEIEQLDKWKDESIKRINSVYDNRIKRIDEVANRQIKAIEDELKAMDKAEQAKSRQDTENSYKDKISSLEDALAFEHDEYNKAELEKQIEEEKNNWKEQQEEWLKEDKKEKLREQMNLIKENAEAEKQILAEKRDAELLSIDNLYNSEREVLKGRMEDNRDFLQQKTDDAQLQAEAEKLIMKQQQDDIVDILKQYDPEYFNAGASFGEELLRGMTPAFEEIIGMINTIRMEFGGDPMSEDTMNSKFRGLDYVAEKKQTAPKTLRERERQELYREDYKLPDKNVNYQVNINSPKALSPKEQRKAMNRELRKISLA